MRRVEPKPYLIGESMLNQREVDLYLRETYGEEGGAWFDENIGFDERETSSSELLTEIMGRLCYRSFAPGLNKNVSKIRKGNDEYLANIIKSKHGSVLEHGSTNWIIKDVSRVFTHELVRHRAGVAVSQESLRYVRMDDFGLWLPEDPALTPELIKACENHVELSERFCSWLSDQLGLDKSDAKFEYKKKWTSFIRRFAPQGMATTIGITINFRAMRHVLEMRTAESAEVEIRYVFDKIAEMAKEKWPALLSDFSKNNKGEWVPSHSKV